VRTDPHPEQKGAQGWHLDNAYLPNQRAPAPHYPRGQVHYHTMVALNDVESGGAALCVVPGSHHANMRQMAELSASDLADYQTGGNSPGR
jgi:ectoine hydroxylase-related dioxygenase (phytanoyl-CoA dioxygenase family)